MQTKVLDENWAMYEYGTTDKLPARVPGSVYSDLLDNKKIEDPFWRDNETEIRKISDNDYVYESEFCVEDDLLSEEMILLHFDGLDTIADVYLNGEKLGSANNMHRMWEFEVKDILKAHNNQLTVHFHSPSRFIAEAYAKDVLHGSGETMRGFGHLRKASYMFGWDWGPMLPDMGIWKPVKLIGYTSVRLDGVYITQIHRENAVELNLEITLQHKAGEVCILSENDSTFQTEVTIKNRRGEEIIKTDKLNMIIENPELWWPNGMGEQPLYEICVKVLQNGTIMDMWCKKIGLRTLTMHIEKDSHGECFAHCINGRDIFALGADYIPEDNILSRMTPERTRELLLQAKNANYNCMRVWGGGFYPSDAFYDACDEFGILIWQDLMFACTAYHLNDDFTDSIKTEVIENVKRLRHHASLALWCGNNEMELLASPEAFVRTRKEKHDYLKMYEMIFPEIIKKYDPNTFYWPASPSSGGSFDNPNDATRGDVHDWSVWHENLPFTAYRSRNYRYLSEFGFQAFPAVETIEKFTLPEDRNIFSYVMEKHQRNGAANGKIMGYIQQMYLYPEDFETLVYATQILQGEAIKYGVEHFRRIRGVCMGTVVWQFNDCWPVASWSSIDYYGRWKALHYYEKRFFRPIMISCKEEGLLSQNPDPNAQPYDVEKSIKLCVCNESLQDKNLTVTWALRDAASEIKEEHTEEIESPALSSVWLKKHEFPDAELYSDYVSYELLDGTEVISEGTVMFSMPKYFKFINPELSVRVEGDEIVVASKAYAKSVEIKNSDNTMLLSDNYFDMNAGEKRVKIVNGTPDGLKVLSVYDIGR